MSVTVETYKGLRLRSGGFCDCGCGVYMRPDDYHAEGYGMEAHHRYFRSQYRGTDRDDLWNLSLLYGPCHRRLHDGDRELDRKEKEKADNDKPKELRTTEKVKRNKGNYYFGDAAKAREYRKKQYQERKLYIKTHLHAKDTSETSIG